MAKNRKIIQWLGIIGLILLLAGGFLAFKLYQAFMAPAILENEEGYFYVYSGDTYEDVLERIKSENIVKHPDQFDFVAQRMDYPNSVKAGRYKLSRDMSNRRFIGNLRGGYQEAVKLQFANIRLKENFAGMLGRNFEADSATFSEILNNEAVAEQYGFNTENFYTMFIPNTYEIYWNTPPDKIIERLHAEYKKFWDETRLQRAKEVGLTPIEVSILASIVRGEALHTDEMPEIAGLYLNRLNKGMLLQADPTVIFANNDFSIRRVLNRHLTIDNPYNTYRYRGLPPGPITMAPIAAIDAVLQPAKHDYLYMCAKDDFSGYHNFATTMAEHLVNARKFQKALDERNIKR